MFEEQQFIKSAFSLNELPKHRLPEVILCGRSNVGKSSFINSFFNRKNLAKISATPGKTRSINFYEIDKRFYLVDLPGYGFAKASKAERTKWSKLIDGFITKSNYIKLAIHFVDSRHKPTDLDMKLNQLLLQLNIPFVILLSKTDKLKHSELISSKKSLLNIFPGIDLEANVVLYSSVKLFGKKEIANLFKEMFY